jgi:hypothetical protein
MRKAIPNKYQPAEDLTNRIFGRLVVQGFSDWVVIGTRQDLRRTWKCTCECGNSVVVQGQDLFSGNTQSCGCKKAEIQAAKKKTPGGTHSPEGERAKRIWRMFRLTVPDWEKILQYQNGVCAISKRPAKTVRLSIDHDHKTGRVRGLLHPWINRALSMFEDNPEWLRAAADYLENPPVDAALGRKVFGITGKAQGKKIMIYGSENGPIKPPKKVGKKT